MDLLTLFSLRTFSLLIIVRGFLFLPLQYREDALVPFECMLQKTFSSFNLMINHKCQTDSVKTSQPRGFQTLDFPPKRLFPTLLTLKSFPFQ